MTLQLNTVTVAGNLGAAPTIRQTAEGTVVANFRLATNEFVGRDANGSPKFHTEWHQVVAWGPLAEAAAKRLEKGSAVYVEGVLRTRAFEDKNGEQRRVTEIKATRIQFLDPREIDDSWADADPAAVDDAEA